MDKLIGFFREIVELPEAELFKCCRNQFMFEGNNNESSFMEIKAKIRREEIVTIGELYFSLKQLFRDAMYENQNNDIARAGSKLYNHLELIYTRTVEEEKVKIEEAQLEKRKRLDQLKNQQLRQKNITSRQMEMMIKLSQEQMNQVSKQQMEILKKLNSQSNGKRKRESILNTKDKKDLVEYMNAMSEHESDDYEKEKVFQILGVEKNCDIRIDELEIHSAKDVLSHFRKKQKILDNRKVSMEEKQKLLNDLSNIDNNKVVKEVLEIVGGNTESEVDIEELPNRVLRKLLDYFKELTKSEKVEKENLIVKLSNLDYIRDSKVIDDILEIAEKKHGEEFDLDKLSNPVIRKMLNYFKNF